MQTRPSDRTVHGRKASARRLTPRIYMGGKSKKDLCLNAGGESLIRVYDACGWMSSCCTASGSPPYNCVAYNDIFVTGVTSDVQGVISASHFILLKVHRYRMHYTKKLLFL